jgi:branched-chain amino acid transport system ATP-binding protein
MSVSLLELDNVTAGYDGVPAIRGVSLTVGQGEVVALLGANGSGKTTTLLTISGIVRPLSGQISIEGRPIARTAAHSISRLGIAHVPEGRSLFYDLTVSENLRLGVRGQGRAAARNVNREAVERFPPLEPLLGRKAGMLSGGEQQMLALARALAGRPKLLMVDEMSLGLAPVIVERLLPLMRDVAQQTGCGVLLVEQHVHMALEIVERAYVMARGLVVSTGAAAELIQNRSLLEASYLGAPEATV